VDPGFIKIYVSSGRTQVQPGSRTFSGKEQEKEERLCGHLAVSSLLFSVITVVGALVVISVSLAIIV